MRRTVLNLTPLLDLLLIIVFASQVNVWVQASEDMEKREKTISRMSQDYRKLQDHTARLEGERAVLQSELSETRKRAAAEEAAREEATTELALARERLAVAIAVAEEVLRSPNSPLDPAQKELLEELKESGGEETRTLSTVMSRFNKLGELVSIWEARLHSDYRLTVGRAGQEPLSILMDDEFSGLPMQLDALFAQLPDPERVTVLFFSLGDLRVLRKERVLAELTAAFSDRLAVRHPERRFYLVEEGYVPGKQGR